MNHATRSEEATEDQAAPPKDRHFQSFRVPRSAAAESVVADVVNQIENYEKYFGLRKRARREADQEIFEATISAVICDAIHRHCEDPGGRVAVTRSHKLLGRRSRYRSPALGTTLPALLDRLSAPEMDFITMNLGKRWEEMLDGGVLQTMGMQTTFQAGPKLINRIKDNNLWFDDLGTSEIEEIIILKDKKVRGDDGEWLEYQDTPETRRYRRDLRSLNEWLTRADIEFDEFSDVTVDPAARRLRRVFNNGSFKLGGRLYGGFWMNLKKQARRKYLVIDGEAVAELDYGQMALRQLYGKAGVRPPQGDLYAVPDLPWREGVKRVINAALYADKRQDRMPKGVRELFPDSITYNQVWSVIEEYHAPIAGNFFKGIGMVLMFEESEIMIEILRRSRELGYVALPIHDSVLTSRSAAPHVKGIMEEVFKERTGLDAIVGIESEWT